MKKTTAGTLNASKIIQLLSNFFEQIDDPRGPNKEISLRDMLMSAYAMFSLKFPSLLSFEKEMRDKKRGTNLANLFDISKAPSDTHMGSVLDEHVRPENLRKCYKMLFHHLQRQKKITPYQVLTRGGLPAYYVPLDGTQYFSSDKVHGDCCLQKKHRDSSTSYYHQMLAAAIVSPNIKTVVPLAPEPILQQDGSSKNDCEYNALKRWLKKFREDHPRLNIVVGGDALYARSATVFILQDYDIGFIFSVKPKQHKVLFRFVEGEIGRSRSKSWTETFIEGEKIKKKITKEYFYCKGVPFHDKSSRDLKVNFIEYKETTEWTTSKGEKKRSEKKFSWVTDQVVTKQKIYQIIACGRARWSIENEVFNTLKNQGYHFEHNYGHGNKFLTTNFALLMMLAFLADQILEMCCSNFKKVLKLFEQKSRIWSRMRGYYLDFVIEDWEKMWAIFIKAKEGLIDISLA